MVRVDRRRLYARRAICAVKRIANYRMTYGLPGAYETMPGSMAVRIARDACTKQAPAPGEDA